MLSYVTRTNFVAADFMFTWKIMEIYEHRGSILISMLIEFILC